MPEWQILYGHRRDAILWCESLSLATRIPFHFDISMPPPLKSGVDYGFIKGAKNNYVLARNSELPPPLDENDACGTITFNG